MAMDDAWGEGPISPEALGARARAASQLRAQRKAEGNKELASILGIVGGVAGAVYGPAIGLDPITGASLGGALGRGVAGGGQPQPAAPDPAVLLPGAIRIPFMRQEESELDPALVPMADDILDEIGHF